MRYRPSLYQSVYIFALGDILLFYVLGFYSSLWLSNQTKVLILNNCKKGSRYDNEVLNKVCCRTQLPLRLLGLTEKININLLNNRGVINHTDLCQTQVYSDAKKEKRCPSPCKHCTMAMKTMSSVPPSDPTLSPCQKKTAAHIKKQKERKCRSACLLYYSVQNRHYSPHSPHAPLIFILISNLANKPPPRSHSCSACTPSIHPRCTQPTLPEYPGEAATVLLCLPPKPSPPFCATPPTQPPTHPPCPG